MVLLLLGVLVEQIEQILILYINIGVSLSRREHFFATFRVTRLTLQTPKLWLVGVVTDRDARHACLRFFSFVFVVFLFRIFSCSFVVSTFFFEKKKTAKKKEQIKKSKKKRNNHFLKKNKQEIKTIKKTKENMKRGASKGVLTPRDSSEK